MVFRRFAWRQEFTGKVTGTTRDRRAFEVLMIIPYHGDRGGRWGWLEQVLANEILPNFLACVRAHARTSTGFSSHDNTLSWGKSRRFWGAKLLPTRGENTFSHRLFRAEKPPLKWGGKWMVFVIIFDRRDDKLYKYLRLFRLPKLLDNLVALRYD